MRKILFKISILTVLIMLLNACGGVERLVTYGIEIEPDFKNHPRLALYYYPESIPLEKWKSMPLEERAKNGYERCNVANFAVPGHDEWFYFIPQGTFPDRVEIPLLPEKMHCDAPGSTEISGLVFYKLKDFENFISSFAQEVGYAGSQGHIVFPKEYFPGILGYSLHEGDRSLFRRAREEYARYLHNKSLIPGENFRANALGLMRYENWNYFQENILRLKNGMQLIFRGAGFGKWSGPNIRETYGPGKLGFEIRNEDNPGTALSTYKRGPSRLIEAMRRVDYLVKDLPKFELFVPFEATEIQKSSRYIVFRDQLFERSTFISMKSEDKDTKELADKLIEELSTEIELPDLEKNFHARNWMALFFRGNFLFPLRKWESYPIITSISDPSERKKIQERVFRATLNYIGEIIKILKMDFGITEYTNLRSKNYKTSQKEIDDLFRIAASEWVYNVDLFPKFLQFEKINNIPNFEFPQIVYKYGK